MSLLYLDASALVKRYVREPGSTYHLWQVTQPLIEQAAELTQHHPLKGYDAVQVASGLQVAQHLASQEVTLTFVSGDRQALDTATAEGLPVENPFDHTDLNSPLGRGP